MFQTFEDTSDKSQSAPRIASLRAVLKEAGVDAFVVPHTDEYQNEYLPPRAERLSWLTGFTGSAGTAIVTQSDAVIFVDGRYTLQVKDQVDLSVVTPLAIMEILPDAWIREKLQKGERFGFDPWLHSPAGVKTLEAACEKVGGELVSLQINPVDTIWEDQPPAPCTPLQIHPEEFAGKTAEEKRKEISEKLSSDKVTSVVLTKPESIAWLLNIRGTDVLHTPLPLCFAILHATGRVDLFVDLEKLTDEVAEHLGPDVTIVSQGSFSDHLAAIGKEATIQVDPSTVPYEVVRVLKETGCTVKEESDPCTLPKARKNETELAGTREAHIRDGAALTRFLFWLGKEGPKGTVDEIAAAKKLESLRAETNQLKDLSFDTISGAGPNGAVVHYRVTEETNRPLKSGELYLVDSGGQYLDGTTDVTRTVAIGVPTDEMRNRFTRVLKGHIALARARFPKGTSGANLDVLARAALWEAGLDFDHGTGHGVGSYLGVHEGPQGISKRSHTPLEPGMIVSNEPGYYKEGEFGIRIENLIVVTPLEDVADGERPMMGFETITLAPIDLALVDPTLMTADEITWLNAYHTRVRETLSPKVDDTTKAWLEEATRTIS